MKKDKNVVFRRINGRVVPIRVNKGHKSTNKKKQMAAGLATAAGGIGFSAFAGKTSLKASKLSKRAGESAGRYSKAAFKSDMRAVGKYNQMDLFTTIHHGERAKRLRNKAARLRKAAVGFEKVAGRSKFAALFVGGSMIAAGVERVLESTGKKENIAKEIGTDFALNVAAGAAAGAFVLGSSKLGMRKSAVKIVKNIRIKKPVQMDFKL